MYRANFCLCFSFSCTSINRLQYFGITLCSKRARARNCDFFFDNESSQHCTVRSCTHRTMARPFRIIQNNVRKQGPVHDSLLNDEDIRHATLISIPDPHARMVQGRLLTTKARHPSTPALITILGTTSMTHTVTRRHPNLASSSVHLRWGRAADQ